MGDCSYPVIECLNSSIEELRYAINCETNFETEKAKERAIKSILSCFGFKPSGKWTLPDQQEMAWGFTSDQFDFPILFHTVNGEFSPSILSRVINTILGADLATPDVFEGLLELFTAWLQHWEQC